MTAFLALLVGTAILDAVAYPRVSAAGSWRAGLRSLAGTWLLLLIAGALFGVGLILSGNYVASCAGALALVGLFTIASNAKHAMLGEALLFSDLALVGAVFRHPQFYLSALSRVQKLAVAAAAPATLLVGYLLFRPDLAAHLAGIPILAGSLATLWLSLRMRPWVSLAEKPQHGPDVERHGLLPMILVYWLRWRASEDPSPPQTAVHRPAQGDLAILLQCESFADPVELFGDAAHQLPALDAARAMSWQWGDLLVPGFGAYTMRTEYGVLFGRSEEELGFRRYDPYLTALGEAAHGLPSKLAPAGWRSIFLHPYDLRFYNRQAIMPAGGFAKLVGADGFPPPDPRQGRYLPDATVADVIMDHAATAPPLTLLYAVTIENHGPWKPSAAGASLNEGYLAMVRRSDAMLGSLLARLSSLQRAATLVFFGDHRPSITGATAPDGPRHTPYVIVRLDETGQPITRDNARVDLTPALLHHAVHDLLLAPAGDPVPATLGRRVADGQ